MFLALLNYFKFSLKSTLKNTQKRPQLWIYKSEKHKVFTFGLLLISSSEPIGFYPFKITFKSSLTSKQTTKIQEVECFSSTLKRPQFWIYKSEKHKVFTFGLLLISSSEPICFYPFKITFNFR